MIFSPLLKLLSSPEELPAKAADIATNAAARVAETITGVVAFDPGDWLLDILANWRDTALTWLAGTTPYGLAAVAGLWLVRKVWRQRQDATWLRWSINGDAQTIANSLRNQGRQVRHDGGNVLLVNAWDSGNVRRLLQAHGIRFQEVL